jgi:hypothetical protein
MQQTLASGDRSVVAALFDKRWLGIAATAAAGAAVVGSTQTAQAVVVTFAPPGGVTIPVTATGVFTNLETGAFATTAAGAGGTTQPLANYWGSSANRFWLYPTASATNRAVANGTAVAVLNPGDTVGPASAYLSSATAGSPMSPANTTWETTTGFEGYLGYKFLNIAGTTTYYGWAHVKYNAWQSSSVPGGGTVLEWAYENTGAPIQVPVPEPTGLALLALGGAGILARRRVA